MFLLCRRWLFLICSYELFLKLYIREVAMIQKEKVWWIFVSTIPCVLERSTSVFDHIPFLHKFP